MKTVEKREQKAKENKREKSWVDLLIERRLSTSSQKSYLLNQKEKSSKK